jgi:cupin superfamily acireductone dioxygenase involved in methionine salvage
MSLGKLEFQLPEEREEFELAQNGHKYKFALNDFDNWLRGLAKYEDKDVVSINEARDKLRELVSEYLD